eukprot:6491522-Amphidinium_carterae.2
MLTGSGRTVSSAGSGIRSATVLTHARHRHTLTWASMTTLWMTVTCRRSAKGVVSPQGCAL